MDSISNIFSGLNELQAAPSDFTAEMIRWLNERNAFFDNPKEDLKNEYLTGQQLLQRLSGAYVPVPEKLPSLKKIAMKSVKVTHFSDKVGVFYFIMEISKVSLKSYILVSEKFW